MDKVLLLSIVLSIVAIPLVAARDPDPRRGLRRALVWMAAFNALYLFALVFIWPKLA